MNFRNKFFSERLLHLRKSAKINQQQLAYDIGITFQAISLLEKGKRSPSFDILCDLADYFQVSIDYLVGRTDNPKINK